MANILDEQERKRKELAAQGIHTRGVAGAQGGVAEVGYVPPSRRNAPINQIPPQNASPQADYARSAAGGAMIPADKVGQARMLGAMPNQGSITPFEQPADAWIQRSRDFTKSRVGGTNQQLQVAREGVGSNAAPMQKSLTQMVQSIDPRIRTQAQERQAWRMMTPQQRREKIGMAKLQQEARTAKDVMDNSPGWEQLADASGTSFDSYGNSEQFYTPDQIEYKRQAMREFDKEWADVLSNVDKTAFSDPKAIYQLQEQLPSVKKYGDFLGSYRFNAIRKYATPQIRAEMDAEDRNQKLFSDWMILRGADELSKAQEQNNGFKFTNDGTGDIAKQIALNRDNDLASGQIWRKFLEETPQIYTAIDGKVQIDPAHQERRRVMLEQRVAKDAADAKAEERRALEEYEDQRFAAIKQMNPGRAAMMIKNPITGKYDDLEPYGPKPPEPPPPRAAADRAYSQARQDAQKYESVLQLQQSDPQEYFANAVQSAFSELTPDERNAEIPRLLEIAQTRELTREDFGQYGNFDAFKEMLDAYNDAISQSPAVLQVQIQRSKEEMERIEREQYGVGQ